MVFQEPRVEFVPIDMTVNADDTSEAGYETCTGPMAPSHKCPEYGVMWLDGNGNAYYPS